MDIVVYKINESKLYISAEYYILRELYDFFSFYVNNYKFMPAYKKGLWDGKKHLFSMKDQSLDAGLYDLLFIFANKREYSIDDKRGYNLNFEAYRSTNPIEKYLRDLNISLSGTMIKLREYQKRTVIHSINNIRSTIVSPTSSGKSLSIYCIMRYFQNFSKNKILIIVPTVSLVEQLFSDFNDYSGFDNWNAKENIHLIYSGKEKNSEKQIYISTWQSIYRNDSKYFEQFEMFICDEVHNAKGDSIVSIGEKLVNAWFRVGFTGTLNNIYLDKLVICGIFGDVKKIISTDELMEGGYISKLCIKSVILKYDDKWCKEINKRVVVDKKNGKNVYRNNYQNEIDFIISYKKRMDFILNLTKMLNGNVLILFTKVEKHGIPLYKHCVKHLKNKENIYFIHGKIDVEKRETIRKALEEEQNSVLIASYGTLSTGVNIKNLKYIIFASPYKSQIKVLQSIGRVLRKDKRKHIAVLFDIVDDLRWRKKINYAFKHYLRRIKIYRNENFKIKTSVYKI